MSGISDEPHAVRKRAESHSRLRLSHAFSSPLNWFLLRCPVWGLRTGRCGGRPWSAILQCSAKDGRAARASVDAATWPAPRVVRPTAAAVVSPRTQGDKAVQALGKGANTSQALMPFA